MKNKDIENIYTEIEAKIIPKSSRNEIVKGEDGMVKIKVTSPPIDGKANKAVVDMLSKQFKIPKKDILIVSGEKSRNKKIRIHGISESVFLKSVASK